jgi:hypothetical protein
MALKILEAPTSEREAVYEVLRKSFADYADTMRPVLAASRARSEVRAIIGQTKKRETDVERR